VRPREAPEKKDAEPAADTARVPPDATSRGEDAPEVSDAAPPAVSASVLAAVSAPGPGVSRLIEFAP